MAPDMETWQFCTQVITRSLDRLQQRIHAAAQSQRPEAVHDLRVAIRRFSQALAAFRPYFSRPARKELRARLKRIMAIAGPVRDTDIAIKFLLKAEEPEAAELRRELRSQRKDRAAALAAELKRWAAPSRAHLLPSRPPQSRGDARVDAYARRELSRVAKRFFKAGDLAAKPDASAAEIHRFRIQAKKFRYSIELFHPVYGPPAATWLKRLKQVQKLLGDINDCRVIRDRLSDLRGKGAIDGRLKKKQRKKTRQFQNLWRADYGSGAKRDWMQQVKDA